MQAIGIDIVQIPRIERLIARYGAAHLAQRILTTEEQKLAAQQPSTAQGVFIATRFAAKEALVKALGTGFTDRIHLHSISLLKKPSGQPFFAFSESLQWILQHEWGITSEHAMVSVSHDYPQAIAMVFLCRLP